MRGGVLVADAVAAAEAAAAASQPALAAGTPAAQEAAAAAAASTAVAAVSNPLMQLDEAERSLFLQAQIMSEVSAANLELHESMSKHCTRRWFPKQREYSTGIQVSTVYIFSLSRTLALPAQLHCRQCLQRQQLIW
eukprot:GHRQ01034155.1.p1 GENE.GHRQ01034155.1~~GHRQ01034155.1.p1  ORF type:complete len:146 (-),score=56.91 GHRQ01034155.1:373-780(-)